MNFHLYALCGFIKAFFQLQGWKQSQDTLPFGYEVISMQELFKLLRQFYLKSLKHNGWNAQPLQPIYSIVVRSSCCIVIFGNRLYFLK